VKNIINELELVYVSLDDLYYDVEKLDVTKLTPDVLILFRRRVSAVYNALESIEDAFSKVVS